MQKAMFRIQILPSNNKDPIKDRIRTRQHENKYDYENKDLKKNQEKRLPKSIWSVLGIHLDLSFRRPARYMDPDPGA